jgi:hypothetical protein
MFEVKCIHDERSPIDPFTDPRVTQVRQTCLGYPEQYEGRLIDRRRFYFRYRHGAAFLGLGSTIDAAISGNPGEWLTVSRGDDGVFESPRQRDEVFTQLLDFLTAGEWINEVVP